MHLFVREVTRAAEGVPRDHLLTAAFFQACRLLLLDLKRKDPTVPALSDPVPTRTVWATRNQVDAKTVDMQEADMQNRASNHYEVFDPSFRASGPGIRSTVRALRSSDRPAWVPPSARPEDRGAGLMRDLAYAGSGGRRSSSRNSNGAPFRWIVPTATTPESAGHRESLVQSQGNSWTLSPADHGALRDDGETVRSGHGRQGPESVRGFRTPEASPREALKASIMRRSSVSSPKTILSHRVDHRVAEHWQPIIFRDRPQRVSRS